MSVLLMSIDVCEWFQDRCRDKVRKIDLRRNSLQARDGGGTSLAFKRASNDLPGSSQVEGGGELLLESGFSALFFTSQLVFVLTMDLYMSSLHGIDRNAGNRIWASTLPAPAD